LLFFYIVVTVEPIDEIHILMHWVNYPEAAGLRHLASEVDNIEEGVHNLKAMQVEVKDIWIDPWTQKTFTFFADPDGLPIELYEC
jgi:glyoxylase I family protein